MLRYVKLLGEVCAVFYCDLEAAVCDGLVLFSCFCCFEASFFNPGAIRILFYINIIFLAGGVHALCEFVMF